MKNFTIFAFSTIALSCVGIPTLMYNMAVRNVEFKNGMPGAFTWLLYMLKSNGAYKHYHEFFNGPKYF